MLFSIGFEISLAVIGFLYVGHLFFGDVIDLIQIGKDMEEKEKEKQNDDELHQLSKHLYS